MRNNGIGKGRKVMEREKEMDSSILMKAKEDPSDAVLVSFTVTYREDGRIEVVSGEGEEAPLDWGKEGDIWSHIYGAVCNLKSFIEVKRFCDSFIMNVGG